MENEAKKGKLIVFEGTDCSGKSTQINLLIEKLEKENLKVVTLDFPNYSTPTGKIVRRYLDNGFGPANGVDSRIASTFYAQDRFASKPIIEKALEENDIVILDRYVESNMGHQGGKIRNRQEREEFFEWLRELEYDNFSLPKPDGVVFLYMPHPVSKELMKDRERKSEFHPGEEELDGHEGVPEHLQNAEESYLHLAELYGWVKISCAPDGSMDSLRTPEHIHEELYEKVQSILKGKPKKTKYESIDEVPEHIKKKLEKYFTNVGGDCFVIHNLPPELTGGALARYSRAPTSMQLTIVNEFLDENGDPCQEKGSALMDRVLNAFGDESVGELEGAHVGIENISQILTKSFEDRRIGGSPIEQSTRYVRYDQKDKHGKWRYLRPKEIMNSVLRDKYEMINDKAFEVYSELVGKLQEYFKEKLPENEFEIDVERNGEKVKVKKFQLQGEGEERAFRTAYGFTIRCAALDIGRCILPSSTLTQLGVYGNGRYLTNVITSLKSGELEEDREKGFEFEAELKKVLPTFIKRNKQDERVKIKNREMRMVAGRLFAQITPTDDSVTLVNRADFLDENIASILFPFTNISLQQILNEVRAMPYQRKLEILEKYRGKRETRRDRTGRGTEAGYPITFDLVGCFAEYRDLQRHRMLTQQKQLLSTDLGFVMPSEVIEVGFEEKVNEVVKAMEELNHELRNMGIIAASQYATLFNHRLRFYLGMNLREFQHLAELRTQPAGHFSYRAMTMKMAEQLSLRDGWVNLISEFVDYSDPGNKISRAKEQSRIAGKNLASGIDSDVDFR